MKTINPKSVEVQSEIFTEDDFINLESSSENQSVLNGPSAPTENRAPASRNEHASDTQVSK